MWFCIHLTNCRFPVVPLAQHNMATTVAHCPPAIDNLLLPRLNLQTFHSLSTPRESSPNSPLAFVSSSFDGSLFGCSFPCTQFGFASQLETLFHQKYGDDIESEVQLQPAPSPLAIETCRRHYEQRRPSLASTLLGWSTRRSIQPEHSFASASYPQR